MEKDDLREARFGTGGSVQWTGTSLAALLDDDTEPLFLYHFMPGGAQTGPCPM